MPKKSRRPRRRKRSSEEIQRMVLNAEKIVLSNMLFRWRKQYGMSYAIVVRNGDGDIFSRSGVDKEHRGDILSEMDWLKNNIGPVLDEPEPENGPMWEGIPVVGYRYRVQGRDGQYDVQVASVDNGVVALKHENGGHISRCSAADFVGMIVHEACPWCGSLEGYDESEDREPRCVECWGS